MNRPAAYAAEWICERLDRLSPVTLHRMHQARQAVFVVEQCCAFQDADVADEQSRHLCALSAGGQVLAYARLVDAGVKYAEPSIGRVLTVASARGTGLGRALMRRAIDEIEATLPGAGIRISAQLRLERFYAEVGFESVGSPYLEDDMPHIEMIRSARPTRRIDTDR